MPKPLRYTFNFALPLTRIEADWEPSLPLLFSWCCCCCCCCSFHYYIFSVLHCSIEQNFFLFIVLLIRCTLLFFTSVILKLFRVCMSFVWIALCWKRQKIDGKKKKRTEIVSRIKPNGIKMHISCWDNKEVKHFTYTSSHCQFPVMQSQWVAVICTWLPQRKLVLPVHFVTHTSKRMHSTTEWNNFVFGSK